MNNAYNRMTELIYTLNEASKKYYSSEEQSNISDKEYDLKLCELSNLEKKTGLIFTSSPTQKVGFLDPDGEKIKHELPVLSLNSTKELSEIIDWLDDKEAVLSWKIDGVSIILYYSDGKLQKALSRGDGIWGKDITKNVILMKNVPLVVPIKTNMIIRGEGCMFLKEFDTIKVTKEGEKYMNPRNLVSGLINSTKVTPILLKHMNFIAHSVLRFEERFVNSISRIDRLLYLKELGFKVVEHYMVDKDDVERFVKQMSNNADCCPYPTDGLVLAINNLSFSESMGTTAKFPKDSIAFKWPDEIKETKVTGMKWSVSQTGLITPIVQFEPIIMDGCVVKQANLHSLKMFKRLKLGISDSIHVYKANKIIPHIERNLTCSGTMHYPEICALCGTPTVIFETSNTVKLKVGCDCRNFEMTTF